LQVSRSVSIACLRPQPLRQLASTFAHLALQRSSAALQVSSSGSDAGRGVFTAGFPGPLTCVGVGVGGVGTGVGTGVGSLVAIGRGTSSHASGTKPAATSSTLAIVSQSSLQVSKSVASRALAPGLQLAWHFAKKPACDAGLADTGLLEVHVSPAPGTDGPGVVIGPGVVAVVAGPGTDGPGVPFGGRIGGGVPVGIGAGSRSHSSLQVARSSTDSEVSASQAALHPGPFAGPGVVVGVVPGGGAIGFDGVGRIGSILARICSGSLAASTSQSSRQVARLVTDICDRLHSAMQASRLGLAIAPPPTSPTRLARHMRICVWGLDMSISARGPKIPDRSQVNKTSPNSCDPPHAPHHERHQPRPASGSRLAPHTRG
jgi:hypothetical protein